MKKALLVTLQSVNIGNRLQNYALQNILLKYSDEVYNPYVSISNYCNLKGKLKNFIICILFNMGVTKYKYYVNEIKREKAYKLFDNKYISNMFPVYLDNLYKTNWSKFDYAIAGSDQIWHRWWKSERELSFFYLEFLPKHKRIAYAPSFGFSKFNKEDYNEHKKGLEGMKHISCRETCGQKLIYDMIGKTPCLVLDPTLLLSRKQWEKIEKKPSYEVDKYILMYFLGEADEALLDIKNFAEQKKLHVVNIYDYKNMEYYLPTPDEFIWLVHNATYICTDSFHATVFSLLFHKNFMVWKRKQSGCEDMFGRIDSLLTVVKLKDRVFNYKISSIEEKIDWNNVDNTIELERIESINYLDKSIEDSCKCIINKNNRETSY